MQRPFYNTCSLQGNDLKKAVESAQRQEEAIWLLFLHTGRKYTASDITRLTDKAGKMWPVWSNRRAITNLKKSGKLVMLDETRIGPLGKPEHFYQIAS
jgi:hypothetical protein